MKKFENILLASDIDGTFVWNGGMIPPRNLERLRYFCENGGHFAFSTGRNHKDIYRLFPNLSELVNMPCILCNGSYLYDAKTRGILNPQYLDPCAGELMREIAVRFPEVGFRVSFPDGFLVPADNKVIMHELAYFGLAELATVRDISEFDGQNWFKAVFLADTKTLSRIAALIHENYPERFSLTRSSEKMLELQPRGISKGSQFPYLRGLYPGAALWCVGDFDNDLEMLRAADVAACPENASEQVKSICAIHLCHCKDGAIADLIDRIELSIDGVQ